MGLAGDGDGAGQLAQGGGLGDGVEKGVEEVLYPAGVEVAGVVFFDDAAVDDAGLAEFLGADDGAVGDGVEPVDFYLGAHAGRDFEGRFRWGGRGDFQDEMEGLVAVGERAELEGAVDGDGVGQGWGVGRGQFFPGASGQGAESQGQERWEQTIGEAIGCAPRAEQHGFGGHWRMVAVPFAYPEGDVTIDREVTREQGTGNRRLGTSFGLGAYSESLWCAGRPRRFLESGWEGWRLCIAMGADRLWWRGRDFALVVDG